MAASDSARGTVLNSIGRVANSLFAFALVAFSLVTIAPEAAAATLSLDLRCVGSGIETSQGEPNDHDVLERKTDNDLAPDCIDPLNVSTNAFIAHVRNQDGEPRRGVKIAFSFGYRVNGNAVGANNSTNDAKLSTSDGPKIGTNPGTLRTHCFTNRSGRCKANLANPLPQSGDVIVVKAAIWGSMATRAADTTTEEWQTGVINGGGNLRLSPPSATRDVGTLMTLTAKVMNQFGQPVQGANVDFRIGAGPNAGFSQPGMSDAVTNASGEATFTYSSNATGTDQIHACTETGGTENDTCSGGEPFDTSQVTWVSG